MNIELNTLEETALLAKALWEILPAHALIFLEGPLGAGKTTLVRHLLFAAGYQGKVKSPTYTLVEEYNIKAQKIFHFDLYRLVDPEELEFMGIRDYMNDDTLCFIEWAERGKNFLPQADLVFTLSVQSERRQLEISSNLHNKLKLKWKNKDLLL